MKILIVAPESKMRDYLYLLLSPFKVQLFEVHSGAEAISFLQNNQDTKLAIFDDRLVDLGLEEIKRHFNENFKNSFALFLMKEGGSQDPNSLINKNCNILMKPFAHEKLEALLSGPFQEFKNKTSFKKLPISRIKSYKETKIDLFSPGQEPGTLKQIISKDDPDYFKKFEVIVSLDQSIYVSEKDHQLILDSVTKRIISMLKQAKTPTEAVSAQMDAQKFVQNKILEMGVSKVVVSVVNNTKDSIIENMEKNKGLKTLLSDLKKANDYTTGHSLMISYIAGNILGDLSLDYRTSLAKITQAALLHDINLQNESLVKIHDLAADFSNIPDKDKKSILQHCETTFKKLMEHQDISEDVCRIILQHHEQPDGTGYPYGRTSESIHILSRVFILCEKMAHYFYNNEIQDLDLDALKEELTEKYHQESFQPILNSCLTMIDEQIKDAKAV